MKAATLKATKQIKKGKLKKTMKNVICRPDPNFWPQASEEQGTTIIEALNKIKVDIPDFKKPLWSELRNIPKELRPKPPPISKVEGLIFGITECQKAIESKLCIGVLIEAAVNPKTIVQPLIETCTDNLIPVLCVRELRNITKSNFGIPTSVLGVKLNCLPDLEKKILEISKCHRPQKRQQVVIDIDVCDTNSNPMVTHEVKNETPCPYLYRTDKKVRVFTPSLAEDTASNSNKFIGQNFIKLSDHLHNESMTSKQYMKMIVKKISSNPNRRKITKVNPKD